jgi:hypothetical protein
MAYLKELTHRCSCGKQALVALYSFRNEEEGRFCRACGNRALERQRQREVKLGSELRAAAGRKRR